MSSTFNSNNIPMLLEDEGSLNLNSIFQEQKTCISLPLEEFVDD